MQGHYAEGVANHTGPRVFPKGAGVCSTRLPPGYAPQLIRIRTSALEYGERRLREKLY